MRRGALSETVSAVGTLEPSRLVQVGAQVSGQLRAIHVKLGDRVRKGDPIAEIDSLQQENELRLARAALRQAQATERSRTFQLERAERTLERQKTLHDGRAGSAADLHDARSAVQIARSELDLSIAQTETALVSVEKAETNLGYTRIVAPMDGRVIAVTAKSGQTLNSAQTAPVIAVIADIDVMVVRTQISEADIGRVKPGQKVWFTTFGDRKTRRESALDVVEPASPAMLAALGINTPQPSAGAPSQAVYFNAVFDARNDDGVLLPMMTADVTITTGSVENAVLVPWAALQGPDENGMFTATVKSKNGPLETRNVRIGITDRIDAEVVEGLAEGDEVGLQLDTGPTDTDTMLQ
ncbi:MAG TPA: efflux RND transporter periplasmic adaptor subunit [Ensifer sp.]|uniref:efflux RND transporter periplasmic adaptor subunit n=1 Tax=Ensifer sp. TaxID=1872086 RepID=UPI002E16894A|nr:efflux RND transporter periplasmic adaptor subunit [Ensifer sp.]